MVLSRRSVLVLCICASRELLIRRIISSSIELEGVSLSKIATLVRADGERVLFLSSALITSPSHRVVYTDAIRCCLSHSVDHSRRDAEKSDSMFYQSRLDGVAGVALLDVLIRHLVLLILVSFNWLRVKAVTSFIDEVLAWTKASLAFSIHRGYW